MNPSRAPKFRTQSRRFPIAGGRSGSEASPDGTARFARISGVGHSVVTQRNTQNLEYAKNSIFNGGPCRDRTYDKEIKRRRRPALAQPRATLSCCFG